MAKTRRGSGEGSIFQRGDGLWTATLNIGYDEKGKRRRRTVYGKSKKVVQEKLTRLQADSLSGTLTAASRDSVADYLDRWLKDAVKPSTRDATYRCYEGIVRNHINPRIGGVTLTKLTPLHIQGLYSSMERDGVSARVRELTHAVLRRALNQGVKWGNLARNVCTAVEKPKVQKKAMQVLRPEEAGRFLAASKSDRLHALYVLALGTGLRQGELLGLHWTHVDLRAGTLSVVQTLLENNGELKLGEPKSAKGRRLVHLPAMAIEALREHRKLMLAEGHPGPWVFCDTEGGPLRKSNLLRRSFKPILKEAKLPEIRFHDLRHTAATLLLAEGVHPKVVQERLGHSQISLTLDTYSHVLPSMQQEAAAKLDRLFATLA